MKITCGIDSIQITRIREILEKQGEAFLTRVYTPAEQALCEAKGKHSLESYAARFAAKEAVSKALGTGIGREGVRFVDMEILCDDRGKPILHLHGKTNLLFAKHFVKKTFRCFSEKLGQIFIKALARFIFFYNKFFHI